MRITKFEVPATVYSEVNSILSNELRGLGCSIGNMDTFEVSKKISRKLACDFYLKGLRDAGKVLEESMESFSADLFVLECSVKDLMP